MTAKSAIDDGIHWDRLGQEQFDRMVEALLARVHDVHGHGIVFPEGRGGDGGRDAEAIVDGRKIIYQFKYGTSLHTSTVCARQGAPRMGF